MERIRRIDDDRADAISQVVPGRARVASPEKLLAFGEGVQHTICRRQSDAVPEWRRQTGPGLPAILASINSSCGGEVDQAGAGRIEPFAHFGTADAASIIGHAKRLPGPAAVG